MFRAFFVAFCKFRCGARLFEHPVWSLRKIDVPRRMNSSLRPSSEIPFITSGAVHGTFCRKLLISKWSTSCCRSSSEYFTFKNFAMVFTSENMSWYGIKKQSINQRLPINLSAKLGYPLVCNACWWILIFEVQKHILICTCRFVNSSIFLQRKLINIDG